MKENLQKKTPKIKNLILKNIPSKGNEVVVAFSGGADSSCLVHLCVRKGCKVTLAHYVHSKDGTTQEEIDHVDNLAKRLNLPVIRGYQEETNSKAGGLQEIWRKGRYEFLKSLVKNDRSVLVGTNLDDSTETYVFSSLRGASKVIHYEFCYGVYRPLISVRRSDIIHYLTDIGEFWFEDPSNKDTDKHDRNYVRHNLMPNVLRINPGIHSMVDRIRKGSSPSGSSFSSDEGW